MSVLNVYRNGSYEQLALVNPANMGYSESSETLTLPESPYVGQIFEYVGTGTVWTLTAPSYTYIRLLSTESIAGGSIAATSGYDCIMLIFVGSISGHNTWIVKSMMGILEVT